MINAALSQLLKAVPESRLLGDDTSFVGAGIDTRTLQQGSLYIAIKGERFDGHDFVAEACEQGAAAVVVEKTCDLVCPQLVVPDTREALARIAAWWRSQVSPVVVAVTGSNGKTTTKEMLAKIFALKGNTLATKGNFNNDIGVPLTLFGLDSKDQYAVIEIGANHPGEIEQIVPWVRPDVAIITMIGPCHLEGFGTLEGVAKAKSEIFSSFHGAGTAVIPADDQFADLLSAAVPTAAIKTFGESRQAHVQIKRDGTRASIATEQSEGALNLQLQGQHNLQNAAAAAAAALAVGVDLSLVLQGLSEVEPVNGRLRLRPDITDYSVTDDSYNANPASFKAAIDTLCADAGKTCLVMGDMGELGGDEEATHEAIGQYARESGVDYLLTLGEWSASAAAVFGNGAAHAESIDNLVEKFMRVVPKGTRVIVKGSRFMRMERFIDALAARTELNGGGTV